MNKHQELTPLEFATGIIIKSPEDRILNWVLTSLLIYCYKSDQGVIEWLKMIPRNIIDECEEAENFFEIKNDNLRQDLLQVGLYLEFMKDDNWSKKIHQDKILKNISMILTVFLPALEMNQHDPQWNDILLFECKKNKFDMSKIEIIFHHEKYNIKQEDNNISITLKTTERTTI